MSAMSNARNPPLLAILLLAQGRTGSGTQIVFHYPPDPLTADRRSGSLDVGDEEEGESSSSGSESSDDDFETFTKRLRNGLKVNSDSRSQDSDEEEDIYTVEKGKQSEEDWKPAWEPLLGLGEDGLVSLLSPGRAWHKRKFELGINDLTFLGRPVYAREDGSWKKSKARKVKPSDDEESHSASEAATSDTADEVDPNRETKTAKLKPPKVQAKEQSKSQLTMFHLVFVMDPPPLEHVARVREMYDHIVKKFSKVLKYEQSLNDYVWEQADLLQTIKSSHYQQRTSTATLYTEMVKRSSLASAIAKIFDSITASKIAAISLGSKLSVSLQIPPVTSTSYLPSLTEPPLEPGLWLTTATDPVATASDMDSASASGALQLSKNFTLLFKASPQRILKDVQAAGGPLALPLTNFISQARPTKSFYKMSATTGTPLGDIQHLARHLVYWRRAIAIPPLHQQNTYIVSPNADMSKLASACKSYETAFPMMPSLPKMLNSLSGTPMPYGSLIPSSDHKEEYYRVLAWLMRDGWVTQLRTFAFVRVGADVKKAVREKERDESRGTRTPMERKQSYFNSNDRDIARSLSSSGTTTSNYAPPDSPLKRPSMISRPSSDGRQSISTDHTSIRGPMQPSHNPKAASLVLSPPRATTEESRWLEYIASTLDSSRSTSRTELSSTTSSQMETAELRHYWPLLVKYFNGLEALERIPVREGLKRKHVWNMLGKMGVDFDHGVEDDKGGNHRVLVTIRHW
jgi:hypothetical protein